MEPMRGMRLGTQSLESERGVNYVPRVTLEFRCSNGHEFSAVFSKDAEKPQTWECKQCSAIGVRLEAGVEIDLDLPQGETARTHFDMVLERRTREELEELLAEVLDQMRERRKSGRLIA